MAKHTRLALLAWTAIFALTAPAQLRSSLLRSNSRNAAPAAPATPAVATASAVDGGDESASDLNFKEAPVEMMLAVYGKLVDRTVLKDPATPSATITLESRPGQKLTRDEQIEAIEVVLEMNGIHLENYGEKFVRALPRKDARKKGIPLIMDSDTQLGESGKVVSMWINFKNISAQDEAQKALEGFKSNEGLLQVFERTNSILVTDTQENINRMIEVSKAIDIATPVLENVFVRQIKNASATDIKTALEQIVQESQKELEKEGKGQKNAATAASRTASPAANRTLLKRPGAEKEAPAAPTSVESLVTSVSDADRGMIRGKVLILADERSNKLVVITSKANMDFFDRVIEQLDVETTPDTLVKVYRLKYANAEDVSDMINDLIGNSGSKSSSNSRQNQNQNARAGSGGNLTRGGSGSAGSSSTPAAKTPANQRTGEAKAGELSKENTTVLADKRINGLVVMTQKELVPTIESIIESMDVRLSQVLIETVIIEVQLGDDLNTGVDWVLRGKGGKTTKSVWTRERTVDEETGEVTYGDLVQKNVLVTARDAAAGFLNRGSSALGGGGGSAAATALLSQLVGSSSSSSSSSDDDDDTTVSSSSASPIGGGLNYMIKSKKLNLAAIIQASKTDSRSKYLASPVIMTVDNKEATIEATQMRYLFKGYQYSGSTYSGSPVKDYEQKDLGITVKVTPKINPNGTVMLTVEEEYSQEGAGQVVDGEQQATTVTRKMSADVVLENMQTVVFGGLTQTLTTEKESGIPILKDIPYIGKWLFGSVSQSESRQELLVFMTPYVLDDAEAAQAEAFRRKKALSDPNPWDDHNWSASKLADPMSKKEQMRRLKDEWKKQDEERKTKLAIEKAKLERAKALEQMDENERKFWVEAHREELEREERQRFDEFLKEQNDLKKLAEDIREGRLEKAEAKLEAADEASRQENEAGRLMKEQARKEAERGKADGQEPAPVEPTPVEPTPVEPAPVEPTPAEPTPAEPTPVEPVPARASPLEEPAPVELARPSLLEELGPREG